MGDRANRKRRADGAGARNVGASKWDDTADGAWIARSEEVHRAGNNQQSADCERGAGSGETDECAEASGSQEEDKGRKATGEAKASSSREGLEVATK